MKQVIFRVPTMQKSRFRLLAVTATLAALILLVLPGCGTSDTAPDSGPDARVSVKLTYAQLVEACVRMNACDIERVTRVRDCIDNFHVRYVYYGLRELYEQMYDCANKAGGDCKAVRKCLGYAEKPVKCDSSYAPKCSGDEAWNCDLLVKSGWERKIDCTLGGLKCAVSLSGTIKEAACSAGTCDSKTYKHKCVAKNLYSCIGGAIQIDDCKERQLQCRDPLVGKCEGSGRSCQQVTPACVNNAVEDCIENYLSKVDCAKVYGNKTCDKLSGTCVGKSKNCLKDSFDSCSGDTLISCIDGDTKKFDCKQLGYTGCKEASSYGAYCKADGVL